MNLVAAKEIAQILVATGLIVLAGLTLAIAHNDKRDLSTKTSNQMSLFVCIVVAAMFAVSLLGCAQGGTPNHTTGSLLFPNNQPIGAVAPSAETAPPALPTVAPQPTQAPALPPTDFSTLPADQTRVKVEPIEVDASTGDVRWQTLFWCVDRWELVYTSDVSMSADQYDREIVVQRSWYDSAEQVMYAAAAYRIHKQPYTCAQ